jgi:murein DD-endopeptidase MepM/ murein hydrolase activator NlpD
LANLIGLHDFEGIEIAAPDSWILDTIALSENPSPKIYPSNFNTIVRVNWAYGSGGTLPLPSVYEAFSELVAAYVDGCTGCRRWIIGNEPNLSREWPDNTPIYPWHYAACYKLCWQAIHALPGHANDEVLVAGSGPWNAELKYNSNKNGDWIVYFTDVINLVGDACDGYSIHAYTHGYDVSLVTSSARMDRPFQNHFYEFYTYRDYCLAIPPELRYLPVYLTEANGNGPWQAVGLMPAMLQEIDSWNHSKLPKIHSVIFYRYPRYDQFYIEGRGDVMAEYQRAVALGYQAPITPTLPTPEPPDPEPPRPTPAPEPARDIDPRLLARGVTLTRATVPVGTYAWRVEEGIYYAWGEGPNDAQGRRADYVDVVNGNGERVIGTPIMHWWSSGSDTKPAENKRDPWMTAQGKDGYALDFPFGATWPSYGVKIADGTPSDEVWGLGYGDVINPNHHTASYFKFVRVLEGVTAPIPPTPPVQEGGLIHPLPGAVITQHWGQDAESYARFGIWGHNGTDLGNRPLRTPIRCIAAGIVAMSDFDPAYGHYVRVDHRDLECYSMYCHLDESGAAAGTRVEAGDTMGLLGSSGNSSGPHLHVEIRLQNKDGTYREDTPMSKGRVDPETWCAMHNLKL